MASVEYSSILPMKKKDLFNFLFRESAWERGMPPQFEAEGLNEFQLREKSLLKWRLSRFGITFNWVVKINKVVNEDQVQIAQVIGFFNEWVMNQYFVEHDENNTRLRDVIEYEMPLGILGRLGDDLYMRYELTKILEARHEKILNLIGVSK